MIIPHRFVSFPKDDTEYYVLQRQNMADEDFLRYLRELSGESAAIWDGFDPSSWRRWLEESVVEEHEGVESTNGADSSHQDLGYSSDDSAEMILNYHKLTAAERGRQNGGVSKLSKARQLASEEVAFPRRLEELEAVKWKETGLGLGDPSALGDQFVPWPLVENYPHMFVGKANSVRVSGSSKNNLLLQFLRLC